MHFFREQPARGAFNSLGRHKQFEGRQVTELEDTQASSQLQGTRFSSFSLKRAPCPLP